MQGNTPVGKAPHNLIISNILIRGADVLSVTVGCNRFQVVLLMIRTQYYSADAPGELHDYVQAKFITVGGAASGPTCSGGGPGAQG
jgi:hypothetical protein